MLSQIEEIVKDEKPDALVVSGDIYHTGTPSTATQKMFTEAIMRIHSVNPLMVIIITAGNHDSPSKHGISKVLWETQNVYMVASVDRDDLDSLIINVQGKGLVAAVPYINERSMPEDFFKELLARVDNINTKKLPVVLSAHITVTGSDFGGHEDVRGVIVGGIEGIDLSSLGEGYDYVALGHIHHAQTIGGSNGRVRYSGTPIPISFDETFTHSVSVVDIARHGSEPKITEVEIKNPRPLVNIPTSGFGSWEEVKQKAIDFPKNRPTYIRLNVKVDDYLPSDAKSEAMNIFKDGEARFCLINAHRTVETGSAGRSLSVSEFKAMEPIEVAKLYASDTSLAFGEDLETLFEEAEREVTAEE